MTQKIAASNGALTYGIGATPIGQVLVVLSARGVCGLRLLDHEKEARALAAVRRDHPGAELVRDDRAVAGVLDEVRRGLSGQKTKGTLAFDARGTPFQQRVWRAMIQVPAGQTCSYQELARRAGRPRAVRAAAHACARNPIAILVPCHRIVRADGSLGGYYYGLAVKRKLLDLESC